jgi:extracellular elastinolytic metalloproteinase
LQSDGFAALTYAIQINNETTRTSYEAFVDAHTDNTLVSLTDFVAKASVGSEKQLASANSDGFFPFFVIQYLALPITEQDPTQGFQTITDPQVAAASPNGWHEEFTTISNLTASVHISIGVSVS